MRALGLTAAGMLTSFSMEAFIRPVAPDPRRTAMRTHRAPQGVLFIEVAFEAMSRQDSFLPSILSKAGSDEVICTRVCIVVPVYVRSMRMYTCPYMRE